MVSLVAVFSACFDACSFSSNCGNNIALTPSRNAEVGPVSIGSGSNVIGDQYPIFLTILTSMGEAKPNNIYYFLTKATLTVSHAML